MHNHPRNEAEIEVAKFRLKLREQSKQCGDSKFQETFDKGMDALSPEAKRAMPTSTSMARFIQRLKAKNQPQPQDIVLVVPSFETPESWSALEGVSDISSASELDRGNWEHTSHDTGALEIYIMF